jgi:carboxyl-terminal processing protease
LQTLGPNTPGAPSHFRRQAARGAAGVAALTALLALADCSGAPPALVTGDEATRFYEEAYGGIAKYYIEPVQPGALAMAGLHNLGTVDGTLSVEWSGNEVIARQNLTATRFVAPDAHNTDQWAALTEAVLTWAREHSPAVASLSPDGLDAVVVEGSMTLLDRFSHYAAPEIARERRAARDGFGGIGVTLDTEGAGIRIVQIMPEAPAAEAGLHVDDRILAIDGTETSSLPREEVVRRLRGPTDSLVALAVARAPSTERLTFSIHRAHIVPPTVTLDEQQGIAHLRLSGFNQQTAASLADLLAQAHREMGANLHGIILDLRGNPGGLLDQSVEVASLFLDATPVSSTIGRVPESIQYFAAPHRAVERLPLVVLVNGGSASASEIVAAALQDTGRGVVVGTASFGKGTVQNVQHLSNDAEMTVTWARLLTPGGYVLHEHGVVPTVCTANLPQEGAGLSAALHHESAELARPRASLDETGWRQLRALCPGAREDHAIELTAARRVLEDPALYARALSTSPAAALRPVAAASLLR